MPPLDLPEPAPEERALSERLQALIRREIARAGPMPFSRFMELALYAPGLGYYAAGETKFGAAGDFITAPESFPLFGRCLAQSVDEVLQQTGGDVLEVGAGSGRLAAVLLAELASRGRLPERYWILELSADLRERQAATLAREAPAWRDRVGWLETLPAAGFRGVVVANELLDAMPVERFRVAADGIRRLCVDWRGDRFVWTETDAGPEIVERVAPLGLPEGYVSEIGFAAEAWVRSIGERLAAGALLLVDYGFPRAEFYHPDRSDGTLMCHYRHRAHPDPFVLVGLQDITAHVDFTAIAHAGAEAGLELLGYTSQAAFLIGNGIDALVAGSNPADVRAHLALMEQVKKLTLPHEMGELYKVLALGRGLGRPLRGFALQDRRGRL
ncbi:MAG TPA: SAM-dependent methyltransferase [Burkholderiales bacterium]